MRKEWEYRMIRYYGESTGRMLVSHMNGARIAMPGSIGMKTPELYEFLDQSGLEGWEAVGLSGTPDEGLILMKREVLYG